VEQQAPQDQQDWLEQQGPRAIARQGLQAPQDFPRQGAREAQDLLGQQDRLDLQDLLDQQDRSDRRETVDRMAQLVLKVLKVNKVKWGCKVSKDSWASLGQLAPQEPLGQQALLDLPGYRDLPELQAALVSQDPLGFLGHL
jgi:hypothetical protein